jgi:ribosomal-protein-alanine N-acetyltransferase
LVGGLNISNVRRGVAQAASVGYWIGLPFVGRGLMTDATEAAVRFAFGTLGLNRLEAACLPSNMASARVLEKTGFAKEGRARRYLKINDEWQDHDLYAMLQDDVRSMAAGS